jgi:hypothetical protein
MMYVCCIVCGYDSGDRDSADELAQKVTADGGTMERVPPRGSWKIVCPKCKRDDGTSLG